MHTPCVPAAALGVADHPAHGITGGNRSRADQLLARLQRDIGDLSGRRIDLVERARAVRKHLHGIEIPASARLDACGVVGALDPSDRLVGFARALLTATCRGPGWRNVKGSRTVIRKRRCIGERRQFVIVADLRRLEGRAARQSRINRSAEPRRMAQPESSAGAGREY